MSKSYFKGLNEVIRNLNREVMALQRRTTAGLWEAGLEVKRRAVELAPVDSGNLRASGYTITYDRPQGPAVEIGFTAAYAPYVHERMELKHPVGQAKFLETALQEVPVMQILERAAREGM